MLFIIFLIIGIQILKGRGVIFCYNTGRFNMLPNINLCRAFFLFD